MSLLLDAPPNGVGALGVVEAFEALPVDELSVVELGGMLRALVAVRGRVDALEARCLSRFVRGGGPVADGSTDATAWLAAAGRSSARDAHRAVKRAAVIDALPALGDALAAGAVSAGHVDVVASVVPSGLLRDAGELVDSALSVSPEELRLRAQRFVAERDRDRGAARHERLKAAQSVSFFGTDAGMGALYGQWDPATASTVENAVDLVADELWRAQHPDRNPTRHDATSLKWRRAEAVAEIARRVLAGTVNEAGMSDGDQAAVPAKAKRGRHGQALVSVLIDDKTLRGELTANGICELLDGTPISPDTARRLACDAAIIPMILGSRGEVLNQGRRIYLPTVAQRHALWIRDRHCQFPGCRRPAKWTNAHHIVAFPKGCTDLDNLLLLCERHHHLVHEGQWRLAGNALDFTVHRPDGTLFEHITRGPP